MTSDCMNYRLGAARKEARLMGNVDHDLEKRIDDVGRSKVFERAKHLGWVDECPPKWVWHAIVSELTHETS